MKTLTNLLAAFWPPALLRATDPFPAWHELTPISETHTCPKSMPRTSPGKRDSKRPAS
jgi:hypothetical protein